MCFRKLWIIISNFIKRLFDLTISALLIIILVPVWIVIPAVIKNDSKGPVFFRQGRRTTHGRIFNMLKFRSMVVDAEQLGQGLFNFEGDPRVTRVGRFLRKTSVDELPQVFNILIGDMSFVGPRPCVTYELGDFDTLNKRYKKRFEVKAGLTGLAQVKGRNDIDWDEKVGYDNEYVDLYNKFGIFVDIIIMLKSFTRVFKRDKIYEIKSDDSMTDEEAARLADERVKRLAHLPD